MYIGKHTLPGLVSTFVWKIQTNPESTWTWCIYISLKGYQSGQYVKVLCKRSLVKKIYLLLNK
jgi:hypothetical protein